MKKSRNLSLLLVLSFFGFVDANFWQFVGNASPRVDVKNDPFFNGLSDILNHNYTKAVYDFTSAANEGNADAAFNLGQIYGYGEGVSISNVTSVRWMLQAAEEGNVRAAFNLSFMYENGNGVPIDYDAAQFWSEKVSADTYADHYNINEMFDDGDDGPTEINSAIAWTLTAADHDDPISEYVLALNFGASGGFKEDDKQAFLWNEKAAAHGLEDAQYNLGNEYYNGEGTAKDLVLAYKWYKLASASGDPIATDACAATEKELTAEQASKAKYLLKKFIPNTAR